MKANVLDKQTIISLNNIIERLDIDDVFTVGKHTLTKSTGVPFEQSWDNANKLN